MTRPLKEYALAAEIIGAIAVVISLVYVGISVNKNTNAVMVTNHHALVAMDQNTNGWLRDPEFAAAYDIAMEDDSELSPVQLRQYNSYLADKFNTWEFAFLTHGNGMMEDNIWEGWDAHYRSILVGPGGRKFWTQSKGGFSPAFGSYLDSILAGIE